MFTMSDMMLLLPALILSVYAQWKVSSTFKKMSERRAASGMTGAQVARMLLQRNGIDDVKVETVPGSLSDHYDPTQKVLRLSEPVYDSNSLAALGVAAHETGHAIQHHTAYSALSLRSAILPVANIGSKLAIPLFLGGMLMRMDILITIGFLRNDEIQGAKSGLDAAALTYVAAAAMAVVQLIRLIMIRNHD